MPYTGSQLARYALDSRKDPEEEALKQEASDGLWSFTTHYGGKLLETVKNSAVGLATIPPMLVVGTANTLANVANTLVDSFDDVADATAEVYNAFAGNKTVDLQKMSPKELREYWAEKEQKKKGSTLEMWANETIQDIANKPFMESSLTDFAIKIAHGFGSEYKLNKISPISIRSDAKLLSGNLDDIRFFEDLDGSEFYTNLKEKIKDNPWQVIADIIPMTKVAKAGLASKTASRFKSATTFVNFLDDVATNNPRATKFFNWLDNPIFETNFKSVLRFPIEVGNKVVPLIDNLTAFRDKAEGIRYKKSLSTALLPVEAGLKAFAYTADMYGKGFDKAAEALVPVGKKLDQWGEQIPIGSALRPIGATMHRTADMLLGRATQGLTSEAFTTLNMMYIADKIKAAVPEDLATYMDKIRGSFDVDKSVARLYNIAAEMENDVKLGKYDAVPEELARVTSDIAGIREEAATLKEGREFSKNANMFIFRDITRNINDTILTHEIKNRLKDYTNLSEAEVEAMVSTLDELEVYNDATFNDRLKEAKNKVRERKAQAKDDLRNLSDVTEADIEAIRAEFRAAKKVGSRKAIKEKRTKAAETKQQLKEQAVVDVETLTGAIDEIRNRRFSKVIEDSETTLAAVKKASKELDSATEKYKNDFENGIITQEQYDNHMANAEYLKEAYSAEITKQQGRVNDAVVIQKLNKAFRKMGFEGSFYDNITRLTAEELDTLLFSKQMDNNGKTINPAQRIRNALESSVYKSRSSKFGPHEAGMVNELIDKIKARASLEKLNRKLTSKMETIAKRRAELDEYAPLANDFVDYYTDPDLKTSTIFFPEAQVNTGMMARLKVEDPITKQMVDGPYVDLNRHYSVPPEFRERIARTQNEINRTAVATIADEITAKVLAGVDESDTELKKLRIDMKIAEDELTKTKSAQSYDWKGRALKNVDAFYEKNLMDSFGELADGAWAELRENWDITKNHLIKNKVQLPSVLKSLDRNDGTIKIIADTKSSKQNNLPQNVVEVRFEEIVPGGAKITQHIGKEYYYEVSPSVYVSNEIMKQIAPLSKDLEHLTGWNLAAHFIVDGYKMKSISGVRNFALNDFDEAFKTISQQLVERATGRYKNLGGDVADASVAKAIMVEVNAQKKLIGSGLKKIIAKMPEDMAAKLDKMVTDVFGEANLKRWSDMSADDVALFNRMLEQGNENITNLYRNKANLQDYDVTPNQATFNDISKMLGGHRSIFSEDFTAHVSNTEKLTNAVIRDIERDIGNNKYNTAKLAMLKYLNGVQQYYMNTFYLMYSIPDNTGRLVALKHDMNTFFKDQIAAKELAAKEGRPVNNYITNMAELKQAFNPFKENKAVIRELKKFGDLARDSTIWHMNNMDPVKTVSWLRRMTTSGDKPHVILATKGLYAFSSFMSMQANAYINRLLGVVTGKDMWGRKWSTRERFVNLLYLGSANSTAYYLYNNEDEQRMIPGIDVSDISNMGFGGQLAESFQRKQNPQIKPRRYESENDVWNAVYHSGIEDFWNLVMSNMIVQTVERQSISEAIANLAMVGIPTPNLIQEGISYRVGQEVSDVRLGGELLTDVVNMEWDVALGKIYDIIRGENPVQKQSGQKRIESFMDILYPKGNTALQDYDRTIRKSKVYKPKKTSRRRGR